MRFMTLALFLILLIPGCDSLPFGSGSTMVKPAESKADRTITEKGERLTEKNKFYFRYYPKDYRGIIVLHRPYRVAPKNE